MLQHRRFRLLLLSGCLAAGILNGSPFCLGQEPESILLLDEPSMVLGDNAENEAIAPSEVTRVHTISSLKGLDDSEIETIRERYKDGRLHIVRQVTLDEEGNYVNHGTFEEWSPAGEIVCTGQYLHGQRQGTWVKVIQAKEAKLFSTQPYARFKSPFQSSAEFQNGQMHGVWMIVDADHRTVSHINLVDGTRDGQATWYHPNGQVYLQTDYKDGLLSGAFVEKNTEGKTIRNEMLENGQRTEPEREFFPNKIVKSETTYLSAPQRVVTHDDWSTSTFATYAAAGDKIKHGEFQEFHENGQIRTRGTYSHGVLVGKLESWHSNGERAISGSFLNGERHGKWSWWHPTGMRRSIVNFDRGQSVGTVLTWNEQGKRVNTSEPVLELPQTAQQVAPTAR